MGLIILQNWLELLRVYYIVLTDPAHQVCLTAADLADLLNGC